LQTVAAAAAASVAAVTCCDQHRQQQHCHHLRVNANHALASTAIYLLPRVQQAMYQNSKVKMVVAVKTLKEESMGIEEFMQEAQVHIARSTLSRPRLCLIVPHIACSTLLCPRLRSIVRCSQHTALAIHVLMLGHGNFFFCRGVQLYNRVFVVACLYLPCAYTHSCSRSLTQTHIHKRTYTQLKLAHAHAQNGFGRRLLANTDFLGIFFGVLTCFLCLCDVHVTRRTDGVFDR
jgi:hypothetical protein